MTREISNRDWFGKSSAGLILGFLIALGISGLFKLATGMEEPLMSVKGSFSVFVIGFVWSLVLSFSFLFSGTVRAWISLGLVTLILWGGLLAGRAVA